MSNLRKVRTGPTRYLKLNEADYKAWVKAGNTEYGAEDEPAEDVPADESEAKQVAAPAENKAKAAPVEKKAAGK
jgi:hypothetical protein